jgi:ferredoxin
VYLCPGVFALDSKNKCIVLDPEADTPEKLMEAAEACPSQAIQLLNDDGDEIFP